eukprot:snap_masked-scaffold_25-processed-gene-2.24-mRNA-1 protein AED:0.52 eAED:0.53 QI:0/-1/0/1/-1/1/1/0/358
MVDEEYCTRTKPDTIESLNKLNKNELINKIKKLEERLASEVKGRVTAEKSLRKHLLAANVLGPQFGEVKPIGYAATCLPQKFGIPRQALLAPSCPGKLVLNIKVIHGQGLVGLSSYSHLWLVTVFNNNTNVHKLTKLVEKKSPRNGLKTFPALIKPPQLGGERTGVFSTRSPHRPNPVALSLVKIRSVDENKGIVYFNGVDLLHGTPVLDIKPYLPHVDNPKSTEKFLEDYKIHNVDGISSSEWLNNQKFVFVDVAIGRTSTEEESLTNKMQEWVTEGKVEWFKDTDSFFQGLREILRLDPRSVLHGRGDYKKEGRKEFGVFFDNFNIFFEPGDEGSRTLTVTNILHTPRKWKETLNS